jgi:hypothetical protein
MDRPDLWIGGLCLHPEDSWSWANDGRLVRVSLFEGGYVVDVGQDGFSCPDLDQVRDGVRRLLVDQIRRLESEEVLRRMALLKLDSEEV